MNDDDSSRDEGTTPPGRTDRKTLLIGAAFLVGLVLLIALNMN